MPRPKKNEKEENKRRSRERSRLLRQDPEIRKKLNRQSQECRKRDMIKNPEKYRERFRRQSANYRARKRERQKLLDPDGMIKKVKKAMTLSRTFYNMIEKQKIPFSVGVASLMAVVRLLFRKDQLPSNSFNEYLDFQKNEYKK